MIIELKRMIIRLFLNIYTKQKGYQEKIKKIIKIVLFIIFIYSLIFDILIFMTKIVKNINLKIEFKKIENYLKICKTKIKIMKKFNTTTEPKISIISSIFNRERYLERFIKSIQQQNFVNIEIIFVDDFSKDDSIKIIEELKKDDKRMVLIKNKNNKGTFISRNLGLLFSRGKYILFPDPDDIIYKNTLNFCYKYAEKYNYEIIRFNLYLGHGDLIFSEVINQLENRKICQPELSTYIYYGKNELELIDCCLSNKFIKKEIYVEALNLLGKNYLNMYIIIMEDSMMNYILYRIAKSFYFIKKIGYYYIKNSQSISKNIYKISKLRMKIIFIYLKLI
jgi:glycosyltransferase involved in cell wall biosynthesis